MHITICGIFGKRSVIRSSKEFPWGPLKVTEDYLAKATKGKIVIMDSGTFLGPERKLVLGSHHFVVCPELCNFSEREVV